MGMIGTVSFFRFSYILELKSGNRVRVEKRGGEVKFVAEDLLRFAQFALGNLACFLGL